MADIIEIPEQRANRWLLFGGSLAFVASGLAIMAVMDGVVAKLIGAACVLFFGLTAVVWFRQAMDPRPRVVLTPTGVEDRSQGMGEIEWRDIESFSISEVQQQQFINIAVRDREKYFQRMSSLRRGSARLNMKMGYSGIAIPLVGLKISADDLLMLLKERHGLALRSMP